jgi:hypothetical protein
MGDTWLPAHGCAANKRKAEARITDWAIVIFVGLDG